MNGLTVLDEENDTPLRRPPFALLSLRHGAKIEKKRYD